MVNFKLVSLCVLKGEQVVFSKLDILKPSWTLRGEFIEGEFCLVKGNSIWNRWRKFQNLKMLRKILFIYLWLFAKGLWKGFTKKICKNKTCGASMVQNVKNKEKHSCIFYEMNIGLIPSNLCTYPMQTSSIILLYICFGLCWHQSPKRGRLKGK